LKKKLVAYLNVDASVSGAATTAGPEGLSFKPTAVASLAPMLVEAAKDVRAPSGKSLYEAWRATSMRDKKLAGPPADSALVETRIGSGSDHTVFLNHLGRPVINLGFTGNYGVYHSAYDDHFWMSRIGDPTFEYHTVLTQIWGLTALRLANSDILPFDFAANAVALREFLSELESVNKLTQQQVPLKRLYERIVGFETAGRQLREVTMHDLASGNVNPEKIQRLNEQLLQVESNWLDPAGIPGRPWFQHLLYSARYTYAHLEFPGLTEAVEGANWKLAAEQVNLLDTALVKNTELLRSAKSTWEKKE
jgi:N-acetylated-alpha-linked acidic dipeptidase